MCNASPDIRQQIAATPELQPHAEGPLRHSPVKAVVLTNGDVDHITGLLSLREREPFNLYASARVLNVLAENNVFKVCDPAIVKRVPLTLGMAHDLCGPDGPLGLSVVPFAVPGKVALYLEDLSRADENFGTSEGDTIALKLTSSENSAVAYYIPACAEVSDDLKRRVSGADVLLFDGTVFNDDELITTGVGGKTGARMGHVAMNGENGSLRAFADAPFGKKIYIHINTTNPVLEPGSDAERTVIAAGWEIGRDGMEISL